MRANLQVLRTFNGYSVDRVDEEKGDCCARQVFHQQLVQTWAASLPFDLSGPALVPKLNKTTGSCGWAVFRESGRFVILDIPALRKTEGTSMRSTKLSTVL